MVSTNPRYSNFVRELPYKGENFPVAFVESPEIDGIENVTVQDKSLGSDFRRFNFFEKFD